MARLGAGIAGTEIELVHIDGPQGVRGRNSDNTRLREVLGWEPEITLDDGLARTYQWIEKQVSDMLEEGRAKAANGRCAPSTSRASRLSKRSPDERTRHPQVRA